MAWTEIYVTIGDLGHGYMGAPITGKLLMEMTLEKPTSYDMKHFNISRFSKPLKPKL